LHPDSAAPAKGPLDPRTAIPRLDHRIGGSAAAAPQPIRSCGLASHPPQHPLVEALALGREAPLHLGPTFPAEPLGALPQGDPHRSLSGSPARSLRHHCPTFPRTSARARFPFLSGRLAKRMKRGSASGGKPSFRRLAWALANALASLRRLRP